MARRLYVAGNWKMNTLPEEAQALAAAVAKALDGYDAADAAICPPNISLGVVAAALEGSQVKLGAQNVHGETSGAFTGEVSPAMLKAVGCSVAIVGHSERRQFFGETDAGVNARVKGALAGGLDVIVCVGETLAEREQDITEKVVGTQIDGGLDGLSSEQMQRVTVAYEPVWAIGTGKTASPQQAQDVHAFIRGRLTAKFGADTAQATRIQYGGSVKPANASELFAQPDIDGGLIGGASLKAEDFAAIVKAGG